MTPVDHPAEVMTHDRMRLRRCRKTDVDAVHRIVTEAQPHLRPWMPWAVGLYDRDAAADFLARCEANWDSGEGYSYLITLEHLAVGVSGLERNIGRNGLEIGYWLHPAHTGQGLATQAAALLVDQAFVLPGVHRLQIWHDAANTASAGIPRRLGFTEIDKRTPPRDPLTSGEIGIDVIWQLTRPTK